MCRLLPVILLLLISSPDINSQWFWENPYPQGNPIHATKFLNESIGIAVGDLGTIIRTSDGGKNWLLIDIGNHDLLSSVCFSDNFTCWAVGGDNTLLKSNDQGLTWQNLSIMPDLSYPRSVFFYDANNGWIAGNQIAKTTDGGLSWTINGSRPSGSSNSIYFTSLTKGWLLTGWSGGGGLFKTEDGGGSWLPVDYPYFSDQIKFTDSLNGWIASSVGANCKTTNGGETWTLITNNSFPSNSIDAVGKNNILMGGDNNISITTNGGNTWSYISLAPSAIYSLMWKNDSVAFAFDQMGGIFRSIDLGLTWNFVYSTFYNNLNSISFTGNDTGWCVGESGLVLRTTNGGVAWNKVTLPINQNLHSVKFVDKYHGFIAGDGGIIYKTSNGGLNWENISLSSISDFNSIFFLDKDTGWILGNNGKLLNTTDGGMNWNIKSLGAADKYPSFYFLNSQIGFFHYYNVGPGGITRYYIEKTTDGGNSFNSSFLAPGYIHSIKFINENTGFAAGVPGLFKTTDQGITWNKIIDGFMGFSVEFCDSLIGCTAGNYGRIYKTSDGGNSWINNNIQTESALNNICISDNTHTWIVGNGGIIISNINSAITSVKNKGVVNSSSYLLYNNFPNPFNSNTVIKYFIPTQSNVRIEIFNTLGQKIKELRNEIQLPGEHYANFDASGFASGVYFYSIRINSVNGKKEFISTNKMIYLK